MTEKSGVSKLPGEAGDRSVWQVLVLYMGASWGVLEVVDVLKDNMGLPDWVFPFAVVLLLIGLPIMLGTAAIQARFAAQGGQPYGDDTPMTSQEAAPAAGVEADSAAADLEVHHIFTWKRALLGGAAAFVLLAIVTTGFMFMRNRGIGPVGSLVAKGLIDERSQILVADFEAESEMLGRMASEALRVDLSSARAPSRARSLACSGTGAAVWTRPRPGRSPSGKGSRRSSAGRSCLAAGRT
jgi:hypothetical protein